MRSPAAARSGQNPAILLHFSSFPQQCHRTLTVACGLRRPHFGLNFFVPDPLVKTNPTVAEVSVSVVGRPTKKAGMEAPVQYWTGDKLCPSISCLKYTKTLTHSVLDLVMATSQCFENAPVLSSTCGDGRLQELGGLKTYVTGPHDSKLAILLISDVFGYEAPNLRKLADKVAAAGFLVVVPDFFYGDPCDPSNPQFDREAWRKVHNTDKGYEDAKSVIAALKSKGVSAIGAAGFCWGGKVAVKLASSEDIKAAVLLHPSRITIEDMNEVKTPTAILGAEIDNASPPEQMKQFGEILSLKAEVDSFVKIFPGVAHGWTVKYNVEDEIAVKSAEEAHRDMLNWFSKYVQ